MLDVQGGKFRDDREQIAAVVEIAAELCLRQRAVAGDILIRGLLRDLLGILGELVHVDDVGDAAEPVQRRERALALEAVLETRQEVHRDPEEDEIVGERLCGLYRARESVDARGHAQRRGESHKNNDDCADGEPHGGADGPVGPAE